MRRSLPRRRAGRQGARRRVAAVVRRARRRDRHRARVAARVRGRVRRRSADVGAHRDALRLPARARRRHRRPRREPRVAHHRSRGAGRGAVLRGDRRRGRRRCPASGSSRSARCSCAGSPSRSRSCARSPSTEPARRSAAAKIRAARARSPSTIGMSHCATASAPASVKCAPSGGCRARRRSRDRAGRPGTAGGSCRPRAPPAATRRAGDRLVVDDPERLAAPDRLVLARAVEPQHRRAARREHVGRGLVLGELPAVELGIARARQPAVGKLARLRPPTRCTARPRRRDRTTRSSAATRRPSPAHSSDGPASCPSGSLASSVRPRLHIGIASFSTTARPVSIAHSSSPRPRVWPTESPTTRTRSGRGAVNAPVQRRLGRGGGAARGSRTACAAAACALRSALGCALSGANTMLGAGSDAVTRNSAATSAARWRGSTNADRGRAQPRAPVRIGRSRKRNDSDRERERERERAARAAAPREAGALGVSHRKIGQWNRYTP